MVIVSELSDFAENIVRMEEHLLKFLPKVICRNVWFLIQKLNRIAVNKQYYESISYSLHGYGAYIKNSGFWFNWRSLHLIETSRCCIYSLNKRTCVLLPARYVYSNSTK